MNSFADLAGSRRSIRKYAEQDIPLAEIQEFIRIATHAPSGCNSQCWRFVAVKDKTVLHRMAEAVVRKAEEIVDGKTEGISPEYTSSKRKMLTFFINAPVAVAVFMTRLEFYDPLMLSALKASGHTDESIMKLFAYPDLLSVGAAIQNLLLAVHEKGYGACWMNEPAIAGGEMNKILGIPEEHRFISLIPIGVPAYAPREKKVKPLEEVLTVL